MTAPDAARRSELRPLVSRVPITTRRYQGPSALAFSPDGRRVAFVSGLGSEYAAWEIDAAGGEPSEILRVPGAAVSGLSVSPTGDLFASAHRGGTERWQIYVRRPDGRLDGIAVSDGDRVQHLLSARAVSPDGRLLAVSSNARDPEDVDVVLVDARTGAQRRLVEDAAWHVVGGWSPDGRRLAVMRVTQNTDQTVLLVDPSTGERTEITPHSGEEQNVPAGWLADGRPVIITDHGREHLWLAAVDTTTGNREVIARHDWGVELATTSADGGTVAWTVNEDGYSRLLYRIDGGRTHEVDGLDGVVLDLTLSPGGDSLACSCQPVTAPAELRIVDTVSGTARTPQTAAGGTDERLRPATVRIPGPRGDIPAFVYRPDGSAGGEARRPALLLIHGGPEGQSAPRLSAQALPFVAAGIAVVAPNIHGSTGYGKSWQEAIHREWGSIDLDDFRAVAEWMKAQPDFDRARLGVMGGSYGGFATLLCITRLPEYWRCAVDMFGPGNLVTMLEDAEPNWRRWNRLWIGDLATDREKLRERSPVTHADGVRCPLLVLHGVNDPRTRRRESDDFVARIRELGGRVEYHVFENEGHGFTDADNAAFAAKTIQEFVVRELIG
jgi:dipeptidyl aminopeptidase/acylaminoacyl peptidase